MVCLLLSNQPFSHIFPGKTVGVVAKEFFFYRPNTDPNRCWILWENLDCWTFFRDMLAVDILTDFHTRNPQLFFCGRHMMDQAQNGVICGIVENRTVKWKIKGSGSSSSFHTVRNIDDLSSFQTRSLCLQEQGCRHLIWVRIPHLDS